MKDEGREADGALEMFARAGGGAQRKQRPNHHLRKRERGALLSVGEARPGLCTHSCCCFSVVSEERGPRES